MGRVSKVWRRAIEVVLNEPEGGRQASALGDASHPLSADRLAALETRDAPVSGPPLLTEGEWRALRMICKPV